MQKTPLRGTSVPSDFQYFRSISPTYRAYLEQCGIKTLDIGEQFGWIKDFKIFQIVKFERTELPPTRELLASIGFKRGVVLWIPAHTDEVKKPWREMMIPGGHFTLTGIGRATVQYWMQWNERARRARKRFLEQDEVEVVEVTKQEFITAFSTTRVKHAFRSDYIRYFTKMCDIDESTVRSFLAISKKHWPLAGLAVHDSHNMSTHLVAFTSREAKASQCWTGLIDAWYLTSLAKGIKYIHFDHLRDIHMTADQQGYTNFKLNFIEDLIEYPKCYFQIWGSSL